MTIWRCADPTCAAEWEEHDLHYRRGDRNDPEEGWRFIPVCPACGSYLFEEEICPICRKTLDSSERYFCRSCIKTGRGKLRMFLENLDIDGNLIEDLSEGDQWDFFQTIMEDL